MPFYQTEDPNYVQDENGRQMPAGSVDPADIVGSAPSAPAAAPVSMPPAAPEAAPALAAPAVPPTASSVVSKLDHPALAPLQLSGTTVTSGVNTTAEQNKIGADAARTQSDIMSGAQNEVDAKTKSVDLQERDTAARRDAAQQQAEENHAAYVAARKQEQALRDQSDPAIDPDQFMRDNGLGTILLAALSGAMGGATGNGQAATQLAMNTIDKRIDQNIAAQKSQIESGRIRRGNLIDYYQRQGFDAKESEAAARGMYYAQADRFTQLEVQRNEIPGIMDRAKLMSDQFQQNTDSQLANLKMAGASRSTQTFARPVAKDPSASIENALKLDKALESSGYTKEQRAPVFAALGLSQPAGTTEREQKTLDEGKKRSEDQGKGKAAFDSIVDFATKAGLIYDADSGQFKEGAGAVSPAIKEKLSNIIGTAKTPINDALRASAQAYGRFQSGGAISPKEEEQFMQLLGSDTLTRSQLASRLNSVIPTIHARMSPDDQSSSNSAAPKGWE